MMPASFTGSALTLLPRVTRGTSQVELVYTPHDRWPLPSRSSLAAARDSLRISVLDSSFNPPTLAHLALAKAPAHPVRSCNHTAYEESRQDDATYDARLLLLSVRNADKVLKPGDATYIQRLEMMYLLAKDIHQPLSPVNGDDIDTNSNVAIAIIDEPIFVNKSTTLLTFLRNRLTHSTSIPRLTFLLGLDTLERLFSPRYYLSEETMMHSFRHFFDESEGEGSTVVCAKRDPSSYPSSSRELKSEGPHPLPIPSYAHEFINANQITLIDIGENEQTFSSSEVRNGRKRGTIIEDGRDYADDDDGWKRLVSERVAVYIEEKALYLE